MYRLRLRDIGIEGTKQMRDEFSLEDKKCLQDLCLTNPNDDMTRIERTKGGLLDNLYVWILRHRDFTNWRNEDKTRLLWIRGDPGKGKTMLLIGVIRELQKSIHPMGLLSYFFCQGTDSRLNNATAVLRGLMYQLLIQQRCLISHLTEEHNKRGLQLFEDINAFIALSEIFTKMLEDTRLTKLYLIVDALDECDSELFQLLDFIVQNASTSSSRVKCLVSSRNQARIEQRLTIKDRKVELSLELDTECVYGAVASYIDYKVSELKRIKGYDSKLYDQVRGHLHQKANETFLWVALVCQELEGEVENWDVLQLLGEVPADLKLLYAQMIEQIRQLKGRSPIFCNLKISTMTGRIF
jgi:NACHT domain